MLMLQQQGLYHNAMTPLFPIHLGAFLKMLRDRHGIAQGEVLKQLRGWQERGYWKVEKDTGAPTFDQLVPIYSALAQAGVQLTLQDRQQFVLLARRKIESMKTRHERKLDADWEALRLALARIDHLPVEVNQQDHSRVSRAPKQRFVETLHLIGREEWLATVVPRLIMPVPKRVRILQDPVGAGKSSDFHPLPNHFLQTLSPYALLLCYPPPIDQ